jgi:hypothetical protein
MDESEMKDGRRSTASQAGSRGGIVFSMLPVEIILLYAPKNERRD